MADEQDLTVRISADTGNAASGIQNVEQRLAALEAAYIRTQAATASVTTATAAHAAAQAGNTIETRVATEAATGLNGALDALARNWRVVSAGADVAGVATVGASAKISGLTEVLGGLESAFAPLLVGLAAVVVAFKAFNFLSEAGKVASDFQAQMETLGASVQTQGGNWEKASGQVEKWVAQESAASGILRAELLPALNDLVTAGHSLADSEQIIAVAEEVAIAKHVQVRDVTRDLISAEMGRARGLELLDANTKKVVDTHGKLSDVLGVLHHDFEKALEDDQSAERANARLHAEIEGVYLVIGQHLLPIMAEMSYEFLGALKNGEALGTGIVNSFASIIDAAAAAIAAIGALKNAFLSALIAAEGGGDSGGSTPDFSKAMALFKKAQNESNLGASQMSAELFGAGEAGAVGRAAARNSVLAHVASLDKGIHLSDDPTIGNPKAPKGAGSGSAGQTTTSFTPAEYQTDKVDQYTAAQRALDDALKQVDASEKGLAEAIKTAGTAEEQRTAQARYDAQVAIDLVDKHKLLNNAIYSENQALDANGVKYVNARVAALDATDAYNALGNSLNNGTKHTVEQDNALAAAKDKMDKANKSAADLLHTIDQLTSSVRTNTDALAANDEKLNAFASKSEESAATASRSWETYQKKNAQTFAEDVATADMSNTQKVAYYGAALAKMESLDAQYRAQFLAADAAFKAALKSGDATRIQATAQTLASVTDLEVENEKSMEQIDTKYTESYKSALADRKTAQKKFIDEVTKFETNWLDDILVKHESLRDSLKNLFDEILQDFIKMIEQMILKSALFKTMNANIMSAFGGGASGSGSGGILSLLGGSGAGGGASSSGNLGVDISSVGGVPLGLNTPVPTNLTQVSGQDVGAAGKAGGASTSSGGGGLASGGLAGAGQGAMIGALLAQFDGGNQTNAALGGALGGYFGGPLGAAAGGLLGSMFGNHGLGPGKQPDIYDPNYGQTVANFNGTAGSFNGATVNPDAADSVYLGGTPLYKQMEQWAAANAGSAATLTQAQKDLLAQIQKLEGGNPNADFGVTGEKNGMVTLANGQTMSVTQLENLTSLYNNAAAGNTITPVFQVTHAYPDLNQTTMAQTGVYDETKGVYSASTPPGTTPNTQRSPLSGIYNDFRGATIVGPGGIDQVAQQVTRSMARGANGAAPGSTQSFFFANGRAGDGG